MADPLYWEMDDAFEPDEDSHCPDCGSRFDGLGFCPFCDYEPDEPEWLFYGEDEDNAPSTKPWDYGGYEQSDRADGQER